MVGNFLDCTSLREGVASKPLHDFLFGRRNRLRLCRERNPDIKNTRFLPECLNPIPRLVVRRVIAYPRNPKIRPLRSESHPLIIAAPEQKRELTGSAVQG